MKKIAIGSMMALSLYSALVYADQVINDDLIVTFSTCTGNDCVNGESFGFDTLRLKENNLRIHFQDTSNSASFPTNDWRIVANDSSNGGANYLAIEDSSAGRIPFRVEAAAPANSLVVEADGDVGIGTLDPVVNIHNVEGNTPTLRLEQDGSSGFTPQTWDLAGNESNFFIRDVTNGSNLPFRIKPGSGNNNALYIDSDGDVGFGSTSPSATLHLRKTDDPTILFDESADSDRKWKLGIENATNNGFVMKHNAFPDLGIVMNYSASRGGDLYLHSGGDRPYGSDALTIHPNSNVTFGGYEGTFRGNLTVDGTFNNSSSRTRKHNIIDVDYFSVLKKVVKLDILKWTYKTDKDNVIHIGPMAEDFHSLFDVGTDDKHISPVDTAGVSLAAIKALNTKIEHQQKEIDELRKLVNVLMKK